MDVSYYIHENNENKGSRMGHAKKILKVQRCFIIGIFQVRGPLIHNHQLQFKSLKFLLPFSSLKKVRKDSQMLKCKIKFANDTKRLY
jgi:hypothetical protein